MKRTAKIIVGSVVALLGVALVIFGLYETITASWQWLGVVLVGVVVGLAGVNLASGAKVREFFEDLFGGLWF